MCSEIVSYGWRHACTANSVSAFGGAEWRYQRERFMATPVTTAKQEVAQLSDQLPDDATLEDIQYHVYVLEKINRGRVDIAAWQSFTTEQAKERLSRWLLR